MISTRVNPQPTITPDPVIARATMASIRHTVANVRQNKRPAAIALKLIRGSFETTPGLTPFKPYLGVAYRDQLGTQGFMLRDDRGFLRWFKADHFAPVNPARWHLFS